MLKHYVRYLYPGVFMPEEKVEEVKKRDIKIKNPPKLSSLDCFAYYFFDRMEIEFGKEILKGNECNQSKRYYVGGKLYTLAKLKKEKPGLTTLVNNMECNHWKKVILCRTGNWQPFMKGDILIN